MLRYVRYYPSTRCETSHNALACLLHDLYYKYFFMATLRFGLLLCFVAFGAFTQHRASVELQARQKAKREMSKLQSEVTYRDIEFMRQAVRIAEANTGAHKDGCVIVYDGRIIAEASSNAETSDDATAHAAVVAVRDACTKMSSANLGGSVAYVTAKPCAMCSSLIQLSGIKTVYFREDPVDNAAPTAEARYAKLSSKPAGLQAISVPRTRL